MKKKLLAYQHIINNKFITFLSTYLHAQNLLDIFFIEKKKKKFANI